MDGTAALVVMLSAITLTVMVSCHQICFIGSAEYNPQSSTSPRWFLPYKDPCKCTSVRLGGMRIPASSYRQKAPYYLDELFLSEDAGEIWAYFNCTSAKKNTDCSSPAPLGMEDKTIPDSRITSSHPRGSVEARLHNHRRWWLYLARGSTCWIEVDLVESTVVAGIVTQGIQCPFNCYVTAYKVEYRQQHSYSYVELKDGNGKVKVFSGNSDADSTVTNMFDASVVATAVRIEPTAWESAIALRLELLGCRSD